MKMARNIARLSLLCFSLLFVSCVDSLPTASTVSIARIRQIHNGYPRRITTPWYISGRVTSSDVEGNFYKKIVIEDSTGAIELNVNSEELCLIAPWCSHVTFYVEGLWIGGYGRALVLGMESTDQRPVSNMDEADFVRRVQVVNTFDSLYRPTPYTIGQLTFRDNQRWAQFEGVQFVEDELGLTWCDCDSTTRRCLISRTGETIKVTTSAYASWADCVIPSGSGSIDGILYYRRGGWELQPISIARVNMDSPRF